MAMPFAAHSACRWHLTDTMAPPHPEPRGYSANRYATRLSSTPSAAASRPAISRLALDWFNAVSRWPLRARRLHCGARPGTTPAPAAPSQRRAARGNRSARYRKTMLGAAYRDLHRTASFDSTPETFTLPREARRRKPAGCCADNRLPHGPPWRNATTGTRGAIGGARTMKQSAPSPSGQGVPWNQKRENMAPEIHAPRQFGVSMACLNSYTGGSLNGVQEPIARR